MIILKAGVYCILTPHDCAMLRSMFCLFRQLVFSIKAPHVCAAFGRFGTLILRTYLPVVTNIFVLEISAGSIGLLGFCQHGGVSFVAMRALNRPSV
jgi:hypothetical protein